MVDENSETPDWNDQELHPETIVVSIVGGPEFHINQVYCGVQTADVDHLVKEKETEGFKQKEQIVPVWRVEVLPSCSCYTERWKRWADPGNVL